MIVLNEQILNRVQLGDIPLRSSIILILFTQDANSFTGKITLIINWLLIINLYRLSINMASSRMREALDSDFIIYHDLELRVKDLKMEDIDTRPTTRYQRLRAGKWTHHHDHGHVTQKWEYVHFIYKPIIINRDANGCRRVYDGSEFYIPTMDYFVTHDNTTRFQKDNDLERRRQVIANLNSSLWWVSYDYN